MKTDQDLGDLEYLLYFQIPLSLSEYFLLNYFASLLMTGKIKQNTKNGIFVFRF